MRANEAPEKVYLHLTTGSRILNGKYYECKPAKIRFDDKIIEYTRTDAFIEKACEWLKGKVDIPFSVETNEKGEPYADSYIDYATKRLEAENKFIENFKNYMRQ